ncbi:unnamed protein product [Peronospora destructor]|uniref:C2H2-type domain-containing protein n=1 Tax=Peronospora destructor TaxID=86335 RepID=A0AAV0T312_9STRA|nr:unnamed protein product [Peronospora destructor]
MQEQGPRIDEHFDRMRANLIQCEECNENFFFDFLRHPRYFVTHFKTCHLKKVLYRFNGSSEEENQRVRFGPRRKKDATSWFSQLKSTEKRMISMQDNKWGRLLNENVGHVDYANMVGKQVRCHTPLNQTNQVVVKLYYIFDSFMKLRTMVFSVRCQRPVVALEQASGSGVDAISSMIMQSKNHGTSTLVSTLKQSVDADRSRLRRMRATPEAKKAEAERSRRRREQLTPAQRQADVKRRVRKRHRIEEQERSRVRRSKLDPGAQEREVIRSRERRQNATEQQRNREAQRSRMRRQNATEEQRLRERERCRRRYETQKLQKLQKLQKQAAEKAGALSDVETQQSTTGTSAANITATSPDRSEHNTPLPRIRVMPRDLEGRNRLLLQQQAGLGLQIQSLYASLSLPPPSSQFEL